MLDWLRKWYTNKFSDPQVVTLFLLLLIVFLAIYWLSGILAPVLVAIAFAYLLEWPVVKLQRLGLSRTISTIAVVATFVGIACLILMWIIPLVWYQGRNLLRDFPQMMAQSKAYLLELPASFPEMVSTDQINVIMHSVDERLMAFGQSMLSYSLASIVDLVALLIYLVLVPLMVFFMLKDKATLTTSFVQLLPNERKLISQVWQEMNLQIMNYIRGKMLELLIVGAASYTVFALFGLNYPLLLGVLVGLSVLIPYIGAAVVTLPVALVALFQWGLTPEFGYLMLAYGIVQALDGNLLVPLLFSEAVDLNPVFIIVAVLLFGGLFGFWGIFFAIPLASLVKATVNAWSTRVHSGDDVASIK
ncbi:AI-2E family transporter [Rheinheimera sp. MMS21-TC3]|uniref:AI-2E family transporter n=1 Tax=Rheinheimera sp. MMS21-TC3 TaxID=3072790 RepID=UPI0028C4501D|nr:AI-2E family transporter [Rheinheimera sp. MMS21-TC3]WNO60800.1 AI-2E family transporter [Rheinheimera sp. MMS21-TC3]